MSVLQDTEKGAYNENTTRKNYLKTYKIEIEDSNPYIADFFQKCQHWISTKLQASDRWGNGFILGKYMSNKSIDLRKHDHRYNS